MEINSKLAEILAPYDVDLQLGQQSQEYEFVSITDKNALGLNITLQYKDSELLSVYFLNNQFYELPDDDLHDCIISILSGNYLVKKALFKPKLYIVLKITSVRKILPERITSDSEYEIVYTRLPLKFSANRGYRHG
jgi:hypothetical protein